MKRTHWLLFGIGGIVLEAGIILCCLLILQLGAEYQIGEKLLASSEEAYHFNPQTVLFPQSESKIFTPIPFPDDFRESTGTQVHWKQEEYFRVVDFFMQTVLHEQRLNWRLDRIASNVKCTELESGLLFLQNMSLWLFREIKSSDQKTRQDLHIVIVPNEEMIRVYKREYSPYEKLDYIEWPNFSIPIEQAIMIADKEGGFIVRNTLNNNCDIRIVLRAGIQQSDWRISYSSLNEPSIFEIAIDEKTGKYHILREFGK